MSFTFPLVMTAQGAQPQSPTSILAQLLAAVASTNPGYTANLPASLIEDISSTDVGAMVLIDAARVEVINSLTPYGANAFVLNQLGLIYGITPGLASNTSVNVVFSGTVGYVIPAGFQVSDGSYIYQLQEGGVIGAGGSSDSLTAIATISGSWPVPPNTVTQILTSVPSSITLTVTNPITGTPGGSSETEQSYRARVLQAGLASSQGMPRYLKTLLQNLPGVVSNLVSVQAYLGTGIKVLAGGGDNYQIANAIFNSVFDPAQLVGSTLDVTAATNANPGKITTQIAHGFVTGALVTLASVNPSTFDGIYTITVVDPYNFTLGVDTTSFGAYVSGGVVTPNVRNITVSLNDYPDTYDILFVSPLAQVVTLGVTWNTSLPDFTQSAAINNIVVAPLAAYINSIPVGAPINELELYSVFEATVASILDTSVITKLLFAVTINGASVIPITNETIIVGDDDSYFTILQTAITVAQG
ncbi:MAG: baseplate J/gp47 family protein [Gammaproteobacteria bacterium]